VAIGILHSFLRVGEHLLVNITYRGHTDIAPPLKPLDMTLTHATHTHNFDLNLFIDRRSPVITAAAGPRTDTSRSFRRVMCVTVLTLFPQVTFLRNASWGLRLETRDQVEAGAFCCHLVSRWCHNISAIPRLLPSPSQNWTSSFPTSGSSFNHSKSDKVPFLLSMLGLWSHKSHTLKSVCVFPSIVD